MMVQPPLGIRGVFGHGGEVRRNSFGEKLRGGVRIHGLCLSTQVVDEGAYAVVFVGVGLVS